ncbi:MAG TPA: zinc/iron-chelating domain-containing protein [Curvibacter sp.]|nr:zinc/iron-chelating domain-containing protein [Curvibacter sp.]
MDCRSGCGACCIAPSISSPIPGMPVINGVSKPAGVRCIQLDAANRCLIFGQPGRPAVCSSLAPTQEMCGHTQDHALSWLDALEKKTDPNNGFGSKEVSDRDPH